MESNYISYNFERSLERMDEILDASNRSFVESGAIPNRGDLTFTNGFYVNCTALFIDIRDSSDMTEAHRRPVLAKIYRSFISEMVALLNGSTLCREVNINGDCVWGVFDTPNPGNVNDVFNYACMAGSLVDILNYKLGKKGVENYEVGIGIDYGRALMVKAGYRGSAINDVIWMGDVVNSACHLCAQGNETPFAGRIMLSEAVYNRLSQHNKDLCAIYDRYERIYHTNAYNVNMNNWLEEQKRR